MSAYRSGVVVLARRRQRDDRVGQAHGPPANPPHVPTRTSRVAPSCTSSSNTMPADGQPIPVDCTLIGRPSNVPVNPSMPALLVDQAGAGVEERLGDVGGAPGVAGAQDAGA